MFSKTTEYALRATVYIAQKGTMENKLAIGEISKAIDSPVSFTAKIMQKLSNKNRVVSSARGPNGGFFISEKVRKLPIRVILEAMGEEAIFTSCVLGLKVCSEINPCPLHNDYQKVRQKISDLFEKRTIGELADELKAGEVFLSVSTKGRRKKE